jgi:NADP-dependent 3-hydroxy acid dehydrogenase YdfG
MSERVHDEVVVVTGASGGVGRAVAHAWVSTHRATASGARIGGAAVLSGAWRLVRP